MAIVITRSESQLAATGAFQAMDNLGTSSVSSSFTVPTNVSAIKQIAIAVTADGSDEFVPLIKISGNTMRDGDAVFVGGANLKLVDDTQGQKAISEYHLAEVGKCSKATIALTN